MVDTFNLVHILEAVGVVMKARSKQPLCGLLLVVIMHVILKVVCAGTAGVGLVWLVRMMWELVG